MPEPDERAVEAATRAMYPADYDGWSVEDRALWHADFKTGLAAYVAALHPPSSSTETVVPPGEPCTVCREPLTDRDAEGVYRAACSSIRTQWCPQWTEAREAAQEARWLREGDQAIRDLELAVRMGLGDVPVGPLTALCGGIRSDQTRLIVKWVREQEALGRDPTMIWGSDEWAAAIDGEFGSTTRHRPPSAGLDQEALVERVASALALHQCYDPNNVGVSEWPLIRDNYRADAVAVLEALGLLTPTRQEPA